MRVAALNDIHGKLAALEAVLADVQLRHSEYDVEAAVASTRQAGGDAHEQLCGDLLEPPDPDETSQYFEGIRGA